LPVRLGRFEYYTLSWFHLYVAFGTASIALVLTLPPRTRRSVLVLLATGTLLLIPLIQQALSAGSFLAGTSIRLDEIYEMRSLLEQIQQPNGPRHVSAAYSLFVWLLPVTLLVCIYKGWRERRSGRLFFWLSCVGGLAMLTMQYRMQYFGSFALYIPWIIVAEDLASRREEQRRIVMLAVSLIAMLLYYHPLRYQLVAPWLPANDSAFSTLRPILTSLKEACARNPGVVLADNDAGHYIRYYTECSVIANNFLLTKQHGDKIREMDRLMALHAEELPHAAPYVKYVLVRPINIIRLKADDFRYVSYSPGKSTLVLELLMEPVETIDRRFKLLDEILLPESKNIPYARLFEIDRERASSGHESQFSVGK
jgi:hypothetical protein